MNILVLLLFSIVNFILLTIAYKMFGKKGILAYLVVSVLSANIQVFKEITFDFGLFELTGTSGNVMFSGIFLATDLLSEKYGIKEATKAVRISVFANIAFIIVMFISTLYNPQIHDASVDGGWSQFVNDALNSFFGLGGGAIKIVLIGNLVYFTSQSIDVYLYERIKEALPDKRFLWIRNNGSTIISQFIDTVLVTVGFSLVGLFPLSSVIGIIITTLVIKYIVALLDTPFIYIMSYIKPNNE
ncbi:queuosine precursor transporter [Mycoplasmatota bacterium WC44]